MRQKKYIGILLFLFILAGCSWLQVEEGQETWEHRLGRVSAKIVFSNNPGYVEQAKTSVKQGLELVSGESVDPAKVVSGIVEFANKLTEGEYQDYRDIVIEVLDLVRDLVEVDLDIPEAKQRAAERIFEFLTGVQEALNGMDN